MTPEQIRAVVAATADAIEERYVFADLGASRRRDPARPCAPTAGMPRAPVPSDLAERVTADLHDGDG